MQLPLRYKQRLIPKCLQPNGAAQHQTINCKTKKNNQFVERTMSRRKETLTYQPTGASNEGLSALWLYETGEMVRIEIGES